MQWCSGPSHQYGRIYDWLSLQHRWLAAGANYGYDRNAQIYFGSALGRVQSNVHQVTGEVVVKCPDFSGYTVRSCRRRGPHV
jgi:hypothetical protein